MPALNSMYDTHEPLKALNMKDLHRYFERPEIGRKEIFGVHLRKRKRDSTAFDLGALAGASEGFSGAEIEQAVVSGLTTAFSRADELTTEILLGEIKATRPLAVTRREEIEALREWARERTVMASTPATPA